MNEPSGEYSVVKLDENRVADLVYIYKNAFGVEVQADELASRHLFCHGEHRFVGFIAYHKTSNEPAAYYGVFPVYAIYQDNRVLVAQSGDTMTHPNHQKKGLFIQLAKTTYDYCKTIGVELIFGFPNKNSYPGFIKHLGFTELAPLVSLTLLENKFELCRISSRNKWLAQLHTKYIRMVLRLLAKQGRSFPNSNKNNQPPAAYILHDELFFRQKDKPDKLFVRINGVDIWLKISENQLEVGDFDSGDLNRIHAAISRLKFIAVVAGCRFLFIGGSSNSFPVSHLRKAAEATSDSYKPIFLNLSCAIPFDAFSFLNCDVDVF